MPHVAPLTKEQAPEAAKPLLDAIAEKYGQVLNIFGTMAHQPDVLKGVATINDGIQNDLDGKYRELAYLKSSKSNGCEYCSHYHTKAASKAGVSDAQIAAIEQHESSDAFDDNEKAVLDYADQLTRTGDVDDAVVNRVKGFLGEKQLVTLAATVALANFTNRFNHGTGVELP